MEYSFDNGEYRVKIKSKVHIGNESSDRNLNSNYVYFTDGANEDIHWDFNYTGNIQTFVAPKEGLYILEAWGAQGGNGHVDAGSAYQSTGDYIGAYGGYTAAVKYLLKDEILYLCIGGQGEYQRDNKGSAGGYNGGGAGGDGSGDYAGGSGGGGATHIASVNRGLLTKYRYHQNDLILVAGGGGGNSIWGNNYQLGHGGGFEGHDGYGSIKGGTQNSGYAFGLGQDGRSAPYYASAGAQGNPGGGGGYYGGYAGQSGGSDSNVKSGGGSGFVNQSKVYRSCARMFGFGINESHDNYIRTTSKNTYSATPTKMIPKAGNGAVKITYVALKKFSMANDEEVSAMVFAADLGAINLYNDCGWRVEQERRITLPYHSNNPHIQGGTYHLILLHKGDYEIADYVLDTNGNERTTCSFVVGFKEVLGSTSSTGWDWGYNYTAWYNAYLCWSYQECQYIKGCIPDPINSIFKDFYTHTEVIKAYYHDSATIPDTTETLPDVKSKVQFALFSVKEVCGYNYGDYANQFQFDYYKDQSTSRRIKYTVSGSPSFYWLRTPAHDFSTYHMGTILTNPTQYDYDRLTSWTSNLDSGYSPFGCV